MRNRLLLLAVLFTGMAAQAQTVCYSTEVINQRRASDPVYDRGMHDAELALQKWVQTQQQDPYFSARTVRTIPVVVHVVYNNSAENISDAAVQQMINQLNLDYRKLNTDLSSARSVVQPFAVDAQIEFCLAQRTPGGQATNGIEHVSTTHGCFDADTQPNDMKSSSTGGANPWDPTKYLNIWVVHICGSSPQTGGIAGYAYIPTSNNGLHGSNIDGVVVDYSIGLGAGNRTWTHEIGHYLGLHHTWGDLSGNACGNVFPDTDDGFSDTPDSKDPNYGCTAHTSCTGNSSYGDLFEDYMDYGDGCAVLFTTQQANYMNNVLTNIRSSLFNNNQACSPIGGPVASFTASPTSICSGQSVQFTSTSTGTNLTYSWSFPGGTPSTSALQNPTVTYSTAGTYNVTLTVSSGGQNNTSTQTNYITVSGANSLPLAEGFETSTFPPTGWSISNSDNATTWVRTTSASGFGASSACAYMNNYSYSSSGQKDWLITPSYNFSGVSNGRIKWDYAYAPYTQSGYADSLEILYSTNCGSSWTSLWKKGGSSLATATSTTSNFVPNSSQWKSDSVSLSSLNGQSTVRFAFLNTNKYGNNIFLDNVNVYNASSSQGQAPVADFVGVPTTVVVGNSVSFTDLSANNPTSWSWSFTGGTPSTSSAQNPTITYNTVGTYPVTLTAANSNGNNAVTKTNYIHVVQSGGSSTCDTLSNFVTQDTLTFYSFSNNGGYLTGNNQYADKAKAEYYVNTSPGAQVTGALFYFAVAKTTTPATAHITATVWDNTGANGSPGTAIASQNVLISSIAQNVANQALTYVSFSSPPTVNGNFYVGFQMTNASGDTVALVSSTFHSPAPNGAWEQESDNNWYLFDSVYGAGMDLFAIPILCTASAGPTASFTANNTAVCAGSTVTFTSTSSGSPTSYSWVFQGGSPSTSVVANPTVTYNTPGTYNVSLTVANSGGNNSTTQTNFVTVYARPSLSTNTTSVLCYGGNNGSATVTPTSGTQPYTYAWSGGGSTATITNKQAGAYIVTVTDAHQCSSTASVNIGQPLAPLSLTANPTDAACGLPNGKVSVIASGGAGGYSYSWNTGASTQTVTNLASGAYTVTVTDANSCSSSISMSINNQNIAINVTVNTTAACSGNNGSAAAVVTNSTQSISGYNWNTGATSGSINNLSAGTYTVTVTLANGCSGTASGQIIAATGPASTLQPTNGTCQSAPSVDLTLTGGTAPFTYSWSSGATTEDLTNIPAGAYSVTITDANGCSTTASTTVSDNSTLSVSFNTQNPANGNDGSITATPTGGATPYTYSWSNGGNTATISNLGPGTYTVTITDQVGCIKISSVTLVSTGIAQVKDIATIKVYPNPANDKCNVMMVLNRAADVRMDIYNNIGQSLYSTEKKDFLSGIETVDISSFAQGVYLVHIRIEGSDEYVRLVKQ